MDIHLDQPGTRQGFELKFSSLVGTGRGFAFPCDADGVVPIDEFSEVLRNNYFYARAMVGSELAWPVVLPSTQGSPPCVTSAYALKPA